MKARTDIAPLSTYPPSFRQVAAWLVLLLYALLAILWLSNTGSRHAIARQSGHFTVAPQRTEQTNPRTTITDTFAPLNIKPYGIPGVINDLNISVWGPDSFRLGGDAYSPQYISGSTLNPEYSNQPYGYLYRVEVPATFSDTHLLVQIFDPGTYNNPNPPPTPWTPVTQPTTRPGTPTLTPIPSPTYYPNDGRFTYDWPNPIGERFNTYLRLTAYPINAATPMPTSWAGRQRVALWRINEIRRPHNDPGGINPSPGQWSDAWVDTTTFGLWHFYPDVTNPLVDPSLLSDAPDHGPITAYTVGADPTTNLAWYQPNGFEIALTDPSCTGPNHDCYARQANGSFYFYLYVKTSSGSSENNFDLRAGPRNTNYDAGYTCNNLSSPNMNICFANTQYFQQTSSVNPPPDWDSGGNAPAVVSAVRSMSLNLDSGDHFPMLFTQVSSNAAGETLAIRHFDQDCTGGCGPGHTMQYQMQLCVSDGSGGYMPCGDVTNNNCFGTPTSGNWTGWVGPNNDWTCPSIYDGNCPVGWTTPPEQVQIPLPGTADYTTFFGPHGECSTSWLRLQSDPSYPQDTTVWEMVVVTPSTTATPTSTSTYTFTPVPSFTGTSTDTPLPYATLTAIAGATQTANALTPTATYTPNQTSIPPTATSGATHTVSARPTDTITTATSPTGTGTALLPTSTVTACSITFTDLPPNSTFYSFVICLACRGIVSGYPDGTFRPGNNVTRGQLSKIVSNAAGFNERAGAQLFQDVPTGSTFFDFVQRLANRSIIAGYNCGGPGEPCGPGNLGYFRPNNNATRAQISKIVANAAGFNEVPGNPLFEDVPPTNAFYNFVQRLAARNIMSGYACGGPGEPCGANSLPYFRPNNNATRGQTSKIVANAFFPSCRPIR